MSFNMHEEGGDRWASADFEVGGGDGQNKESRREGSQRQHYAKDEIYYEKYIRQVKSSAPFRRLGNLTECERKRVFLAMFRT
jgi:hypothetical protein